VSGRFVRDGKRPPISSGAICSWLQLIAQASGRRQARRKDQQRAGGCNQPTGRIVGTSDPSGQSAGRASSPRGIIMNRKSLTDLEQSHQALEDQIADAMLHKAVDDLEIGDLKRRKLQIKDEIERLRREVDKAWLNFYMNGEPAAKKRKLWRLVAVMFFISCLLTASGVIEFVLNERLSLFASLEIILGMCGIVVTLMAWLFTLVR
jgi:hypothetical protein